MLWLLEKLKAELAKKDKIIEDLSETVTAVKGILNDDQLEKLKNPAKNLVWTDRTIQKALHDYLVGGSTAYNFQRPRGHPNPHIRTLQRHMSVVKCEPGLNGMEDFTRLMKSKVKNMPPLDRNCGLMIDEMSIQPKKVFNTTNKLLLDMQLLHLLSKN